MILDDAIKISILIAIMHDKHSFNEIFDHTNQILKKSKMRTISKTTFSKKLKSFTRNHPDSLLTNRWGFHVPKRYNPRSYYYVLNPDDLYKTYYSVVKNYQLTLKNYYKKIQNQKSTVLVFYCIRLVDEILTLKKLCSYLVLTRNLSKINKNRITKIEKDLDKLIIKTHSLLQKKEPDWINQFDNIIMSRLIMDDIEFSYESWNKFFEQISFH